MTPAPRRRVLAVLAGPPLLSTLALGTLALGGCAAPAVDTLRRRPPADLPPQALLADVPFHPSDDSLCGPAVLASVLAAAGRPVAPATLTPQVHLPGRAGTLQTEMLAGARRHGTLAVPLPPALPDALREVAAGRPVAVLLNLALPWWPRWHYAVLLGYDLARGTVWLHSGTQARSEWSMTSFEHTWARSGHWAFVALPPGQLPLAGSAADVTRALLGMDRAAPPADAAQAWAAAARRWPDDTTLAIGAGNAWLAAGQLDAAAQAFEAAAARFDSAVAWNNLAQVRLRQGDRAAATVAARRALARAAAAEPQWHDAARRTLEEIGQAGR